MSFQTPITIKEVVENIHSRKYLLPAIQREVVWTKDQITKLFDSLMRDYPIGSFLFWHVEKKNAHDYQFYEFIRHYHERNQRHNPKANVSGQDDITAILDGQQRLTALYLGLKGSYTYKEPRTRWDNPQAFPLRRLYIDLLAPLESEDDTDMQYDIRFLSEDEVADYASDEAFWFKVGDILDLSEHWEVNDYLIRKGLSQREPEQALFANKTLFKLWSAIHDSKVINYFLEKDEKLSKVLNIFIRVNSGGTDLSYSDLLLSMATAQWKNLDAREVITSFVDELNDIGDGFNFSKDFVLKSCLVLAEIGDIAFKVENFNERNLLSIERQWGNIASAIRCAVNLVSSFGYSRDTLVSNNAVIPIAHYLKTRGSPKNYITSHQYGDDRKCIRRWLTLALVKMVFGGQPDSVLRPMREIIRLDSNGFPLEKVVERFRGTDKSLVTSEDDIENMLCYKYKQGYTFSTLALVYPALDFRHKFHIDHIHPKSLFTKTKLRQRDVSDEQIRFYMDSFDLLPNLQLLEGPSNQEKSSIEFAKWIKSEYRVEMDKSEYMRRHFIPDTDLSLGNFKRFFALRKARLKNELCQILGVSEGS